MALRVEELVLDDWAIDELSRHRISATRAYEVQTNRHILLRNKRSGRATHRMVGVDNGGRMLTICIAPIYRRARTWEVITGWDSTPGERSLYEGR